MEQRDNSGVLFRERDKTNERGPDYTGKCMVNGTEMRIAAWIKEGRNGKFMSLAFSEPRHSSGADDTGSQQSNYRQVGNAVPDLDDSIPFAPEWRI